MITNQFKTLLSTFLFTILSIPFLQAQPDFRSGYVITLEGDTLNGQIDYREELFLGTLCKYRPSVGATVTEFRPDSILGFRFSGSKNYVAREIDGKMVFLEYLINGKINMYYLRDENGQRYYFDKEGVALTEIPFDEGIRYKGSQPYEFKTTRHIGLLQHYMKESPNTQSKAVSIKKPTHKNLIELAKDYHYDVCEEGEECIVYERKPARFRLAVEPAFGAIKFRGRDGWLSFWSKEFGGNIYLWIPGSYDKFTLKMGLFRQIHPGTPPDVWRIPIQIQYLYSVPRIQPKASFGFNTYYRKGIEVRHNFALNGGANFSITNSISLSTTVNTEFVPTIANPVKGRLFYFLSYSFNFGLYIQL